MHISFRYSCRKFAAVSSVITVSSNGRRNPLCLNSDIISSFTVIRSTESSPDVRRVAILAWRLSALAEHFSIWIFIPRSFSAWLIKESKPSVPVCSPAQYQMQPPSSGLHILSLPEPGQIPRKIPVFSISTTLFIWAIYPLLTSTAGTVHEEVSDTSTLHLPHHPVVQTSHGIRRLSAGW